MTTPIPLLSAWWASTSTLFLVGGIVLLYLGAELLVKSASSLALGMGLKAATIGVTVIAFATTAPELFVAMFGGLEFSSDIGLGTIVGSNIANIGLVLGLSAVIQPLSVDRDLLFRHGPFMLAAAVLLVVLGSDGRLTSIDGLLLLGLLAVFTAFTLHDSRNSESGPNIVEDIEVEESDADINWRAIAMLVGALVLLLVGSRWLVRGSVELLRSFGFPQILIGLTVVAFGTSLPELATSVVSAIREESEFSIGNVIGSNIYNILAVIGFLTIIVPVNVSQNTMSFEFPVMIVFTLGIIAIMGYNRTVSRWNGVVLICGYLGFVYQLFLNI